MRRLKIFACTVGVVLSLSSCDNFLSELPDDRTQINSIQKAKDLLVYAYPSYNSATFLEAMSDNVADADIASSVRDNRAYYLWGEGESIEQDSPAGYWDGCYKAISRANQALESIKTFPVSTESRGVVAEAHLARAYAHFMLVSIWGKAYNPATAASDLGIPYVLTPEIELIKKYKRNTVQEVYDLIEADLLAGLADVSKVNYEGLPRKFHFTNESARAFAVRFYQNKGDWDKVLEYSSSLGVKPTTKLRDYVQFNSLLPDPAAQLYASTEPVTNLLVTTVPSRYTYTFYYDRFSTATDHMLNTILGNRNNPFGKMFVYKTVRYRDEIRMIGKQYEYFKVTNPSAGTGYAFMQAVLFSNDEMYLSRIEALVMVNRIDDALVELTNFIGQRTVGFNASTDKVTLVKLRSMFPNASTVLTPFYSMTPDQAVVVQAIAETRRRELIHESNRWFDIKRFDMEVVHNIGFDSNVLPKGDLRRQLQIPLHVLNAGLTPNPR